jgi:hypothetical protein
MVKCVLVEVYVNCMETHQAVYVNLGGVDQIVQSRVLVWKKLVNLVMDMVHVCWTMNKILSKRLAHVTINIEEMPVKLNAQESEKLVLVMVHVLYKMERHRASAKLVC